MTDTSEAAATSNDGSEETAVVADSGSPAPDIVGSWAAAYESAVRFAAGFVGVVVDRAQQAAAAAPAEPVEDEASVADQPDSEVHVPGAVFFGFAADLPDRLGRMSNPVTESTGLVRGAVGFGWRVVAESPVGWLVSKPFDAVMEVVDAEAERLADIGRTEVTQGRVLVERVVDNTIDGVLDNVSESDALNELIRDQAFGITDAAIQEVRETGAAADNLTDSAIRKILRREPRSLPPKPGDGSS